MPNQSIPQVGQIAPDFALPDSNGNMRRLSELVSSGPVVLIFFRGHW
jgi:peroxiredoxin